MNLDHVCPFCQSQHRSVANVDDPTLAPVSGDVGFCRVCGEFFYFGLDGATRRPTDDEYPDLIKDPDCRHIRELWLKQRELDLLGKLD